MSDEITLEQKKEFVVKALGLAGFEETPAGGIYFKEHEDKKLVVDITAGTTAYFKKGKDRIAQDDDAGTLAKLDTMIIEAEDGRMPTNTTANMHYVKDTESLADDDPAKITPEMLNTQTDEKDTSADDIDAPEHKKYDLEQPDKKAPEKKKADIENMATSNNLLELIQKYVGNDVLQVFGDTGAGKSKFCLETAREAIAAGKKVYYLDTERNLTDEDVASLSGCTYKYTPILNEIDEIVQKLPAVDVVILDSIGFPVLTKYARLSMKQKGDALLQLIAIFGDLKTWAYINNGVAIVTNQPESEFGKERGHIYRPFGDKSQLL